MPENVRYFKLNEDIGIEPDVLVDPKTGEPVANPKAGELGPLVEFKVTVAVPEITKINGVDELIPVAREIRLPDPRYAVVEDAAERVLKAHDPIVANTLAEHPHWREVEPNPKKAAKSAEKE